MSKTVEPIRKQIHVEAPQERAFRVFTENMMLWWPAAHHIGKSPMKAIELEQREGGRWYEVGEDGSQCNWGKVLVWHPSSSLTLAWQINAEWQYDASFVTEVEVTFTAETPRRTLVELEHRNLERFGDATAAMREQLQIGWDSTMTLYATQAITG